MLRAANLTGKPLVQTELQATTLQVVITWNLAISAPKKTRKTKAAKRKRQEPVIPRQTTTTSAAAQPSNSEGRRQSRQKTKPPPTRVTAILQRSLLRRECRRKTPAGQNSKNHLAIQNESDCPVYSGEAETSDTAEASTADHATIACSDDPIRIDFSR